MAASCASGVIPMLEDHQPLRGDGADTSSVSSIYASHVASSWFFGTRVPHVDILNFNVAFVRRVDIELGVNGFRHKLNSLSDGVPHR